jgi:hypothetical protein
MNFGPKESGIRKESDITIRRKKQKDKKLRPEINQTLDVKKSDITNRRK